MRQLNGVLFALFIIALLFVIYLFRGFGTDVWLKIIAVMVGFSVIRLWSYNPLRTCWVDEVWFDGETLLIKRGDFDFTASVNQIVTVETAGRYFGTGIYGGLGNRITVKFREPTLFGAKIVFSPVIDSGGPQIGWPTNPLEYFLNTVRDRRVQ